ncbi:biotin/lipoyl-containing protein [Pseudooceanicola nanhaiensis]|uniref:biotin/lipoyl-containing protein n=1 Tax=Pseudooceanicola nanhaiensis TaxID=375761 RepID=UPI001CD610E2|nr:biotin/lipoyl-containing protein [Pseudooceanicola nanhaiensis]MCA0919973.1 hypothetical protein [Pseudooceanicola nanhaiensis]
MTKSALSPAQLSGLAAQMRAHGVTELDLRLPGGERIRLAAAAPARPAPAPARATPPARPDAARTIPAPGPGRLMFTHPARTQPAARPGDRVAPGDIVAWLAVESLISPVTAPAAGTLGDAQAEDGALLGYGSPVFTLVPDDAPKSGPTGPNTMS